MTLNQFNQIIFKQLSSMFLFRHSYVLPQCEGYLPALLLLQWLNLLAEDLGPAAAVPQGGLSVWVVASGLFWKGYEWGG